MATSLQLPSEVELEAMSAEEVLHLRRGFDDAARKDVRVGDTVVRPRATPSPQARPNLYYTSFVTAPDP